MSFLKRTLFSGIAALGFVLGAGSAFAATLQDWGSETFDPNTNLAWLDLTLTESQSPNAALASNTSYRFGTLSEVLELYVNAGLPSFLPTDFRTKTSAAYQADAAALVSLLGATFSSAGASGTQGLALSDTPSSPSNPFTDPFVSASATIGTVDRGLAVNGWLAPTASFGDVGVFLVRDVTPIPLPATGLMLIAGVGMIGAAKASRRKRA